ncbi:hypothetical protein [Ferruginibacter albus]|uniref:hypothetical protein n=1 Tax=Ferruginibacter albus TaxID=2875540 RepID=UPI001CC7C46F|nr:hypothetical protein [Ferruginibacter albus]UAY53561.1 hypothetical protein K9M53_07810 [Ferruginibacter albus]
MMTKENSYFKNALIITGIKLLQDFEKHTYHSLHDMLLEMKFELKKRIHDNSVHLYSSFFHKDDSTTLIFFNIENLVFKVRYLNMNIEVLF